jgi:hypothetical protein
VNHFTDRKGWNGIRATPTWRFRAKLQRGGRTKGAYFTNLHPSAPNFFAVTRVPVTKRALSVLFDTLTPEVRNFLAILEKSFQSLLSEIAA